jgi:tetratricopeptide (TPR) repeat protein
MQEENKQIDPGTMERLVQGNEQIGYYRSISNYEEALKISKEMLELVKELGLQESEAHGTTLLNAATAYRAAGMCEKAIAMYRAAEQIFKNLGIQDERLAGLYNNMSMAFQQKEDYGTAESCLLQALAIVRNLPDHKVEEATTYANLASVCYEKEEFAQGIEYVRRAIERFEECEEKDAHYCGALALLAQGHYEQGELEKAISAYTEALREILAHFGKNESYAMTCENCAIVLSKAGFAKEAEYLKKEAKETYENIRRPKKEISGLELSKCYYETYGKAMLKEQFPEYADRVAAGLVGHGSECLGFDDMWSKDHDFGPGFCLWLTEKDYEKVGQKMQEAYEALPKAFMGYPARNTSKRGGGRVGVLSIPEFYEEFTGNGAWSEMEDEKLAMAVNGEMFDDPLGEFSAIREQLQNGMPFAVWKRRLANAVALTAQAGQYNYGRCKKRNDIVAANLVLDEFVREGMRTAYLLNRRYMPYYKWAWRGLENLERLSELKPLFEQVLSSEGERESVVEEICARLLEELKRQNLTYGEETFLELHVERILEAKEEMNPIIEQIVEMEWEMFQNVRNTGGRAACQDDFETFDVMRKSQFLIWDLPLLESYWQDLQEGKAQGRNLVMEKYAYMMESTAPKEYEAIATGLPKISEEKQAMVEQIVAIQVGWREEFAEKYPHLSGQARIIHTSEDTLYDISFETYLRGELKTYSMQTLVLYGRRIVAFVQEQKNMTEEIMRYTTAFYGYKTLEDAEIK